MKLTPAVEGALCIALAMVFIWKGLLPAWRVLNTDFPNYYLVARLFHEGYSLDRIYDWIWLQRIKDHWGLDQPLVGFAGLTPLSALPIVPLSIFTALTAKRIWIVLNLGFLTAGTELLYRSTSMSRRRIWLLSLLAVLPLRTNFLYGQMHLLVLFLMTLAYFFHRRDRGLMTGVCVALAGALKVYPLLFVLYFLWKRQWRPAFATLGATIAIVITSGLGMGWNVLRIYAFQMLPRSLQGETLDPYNLHAASGAALLHRLFLFEPSLNPAPVHSSSTLYAFLYPLWQMMIFLPLLWLLNSGKKDEAREPIEWAAFLFSLLLLSPVPSSYHFVVMILPMVLFVDAMLRRGHRTAVALAILLYFLISTSGIVGSVPALGPILNAVLALSRLWFGIALFALFLAALYHSRSLETIRQPISRYALLTAFAIIGLFVSITGYWHHFLHRKVEMSRRIAPPAPNLLATSPHPTPDGTLFVGMTPGGYRIFRVGIPEPVSGTATTSSLRRRDSDQLSFATVPDRSLFMEIADASGSRIVRVSDHSVVTEGAESPAISGDGTQLAFLRESKGRGSLWITPLPSSPQASQITHILPLTGDSYDVRDHSFFRSGLLLFLAGHNGHSSLFTVTAGSEPVPFFSPENDLGSFSLSPDEHHIAFTELVNHRWQLAVLDTSSRRVRILTTTDCNAYTPSWSTPSTILYATDCGRGVGLTALASRDLSSPTE